MLHVSLHLSAAYHPQSDGQTEIVNKSLECYLRCMCGEKPNEWLKWLPLAEYWYNTNFHSAINTTPFKVVYGQPPTHHLHYTTGDSRVDAVDRSLVAREQTIVLLKFYLQRAQDRIVQFANKHIFEREFQVGD